MLGEMRKKNSYELSLNFAEGLFQKNQDKSGWELVLPKSKTPWKMQAAGQGYANAYSYHPSLALPIIEKNNYVCPDKHMEYLKNLLGSIDRIAIIGWKMGDPFLINLLIEELKTRKIPIAVIGGKNVSKLAEGLQGEIKSNISLVGSDGFSGFLSSDEGENFLIAQ